jgi:hypothetical protein
MDSGQNLPVYLCNYKHHSKRKGPGQFSNPKFITNLLTFEEMAVPANYEDKKITSKFADIGKAVMIDGHSDYHEKYLYQFMNFNTKMII